MLKVCITIKVGSGVFWTVNERMPPSVLCVCFCPYMRMKFYKVKVKVTSVQALRLCTVRTAHRGSRGIALSFHDHGTRRE